MQQYRSDGVFEAQMRRFVSAESAMTTKQRKQYALAQEAYKLESGETAEDSFLRIMKAPGKDSSAGGGGAGEWVDGGLPGRRQAATCLGVKFVS